MTAPLYHDARQGKKTRRKYRENPANYRKNLAPKFPEENEII